MRMRRRRTCLAAGAFVLGAAACDKTPQGASPSRLPEWIAIASTGEGGQVQYLPRSIVRAVAAGTTDVTIRITYPNFETWTIDLPPYVEHKTFPAELVTLRFECAERRFAIVRRDALADDGSVKETISPPIPARDRFAPIVPGGIASAAEPAACHT